MKKALTVTTMTLGLALAAAPAQAATTIGSDLAATPDVFPAVDATAVTTSPLAVDPTPLTAPADGVLVRLRIRHGPTTASPGTYSYRVISGTAPIYTARPATACGSDQPIGFLRSAPAGIDTYIPTDYEGRPRGVPIQAGERLGVWLNPRGGNLPPSGVTGAGAQLHSLQGNHASGTRDYGPPIGPFHWLIQGVVEPDVDGDGFGDETQDADPTTASTASCTPPVQSVVETVTVPGPTLTVPGPTLPVPAGKAPVGRLSLPKQRIDRSLAATVNCNEACGVALALRFGKQQLSRVTTNLPGAGSRKVSMPLSHSEVQQLLARSRGRTPVKLTLSGSFSDGDGTSVRGLSTQLG